MSLFLVEKTTSIQMIVQISEYSCDKYPKKKGELLDELLQQKGFKEARARLKK